MMTMLAVLPNEGAIFRAVLRTFSPRATTPRMRSFRFSAFSPIALATMSGVPKGGAATVMMVPLQLLDGGAVEQRRRVGGNVDQILQIPVMTGVVVAVVAPDDRTSGVIRVIGVTVTSEYVVTQLGQIDFVPIGVILEVAKDADTK